MCIRVCVCVCEALADVQAYALFYATLGSIGAKHNTVHMSNDLHRAQSFSCLFLQCIHVLLIEMNAFLQRACDV